MFTSFIKYFGKLGMRVFFKKIYFSNFDQIPKGNSNIFAVNHPTAFLDPVVVGTFAIKDVYFILRGDLFRSAISRWLLKQIHCVPVYRASEGLDQVKKNQATFEQCFDYLSAEKAVMILAEGKTKHEKRMRPIQKGTARIAFGAFEKYPDINIAVIPVGVNYTDSNQFRSEVKVDFGEAIMLSDYIDAYQENPAKGIKKLTAAVSEGMKKRIVHIDEPADDSWINELLEMKNNENPATVLPVFSTDDTKLKKELANVKKLNRLDELTKTEITKDLQEYQELLKKYGTNDFGIAQAHFPKWWHPIFFLVGFIPFLIGYLVFYPPFRLAKYIADSKIKKIEFHSSVRYAIGLVFTPIYLLFLASLIGLFIAWQWALMALVLIPMTGFFALYYRDLWLDWRSAKSIDKMSKGQLVELHRKRGELLKAIQ